MASLRPADAVGIVTDHVTLALEQLHYEAVMLRASQERLMAVRTLDGRLPARVATAVQLIRAARQKIEMTAGLLSDDAPAVIDRAQGA